MYYKYLQNFILDSFAKISYNSFCSLKFLQINMFVELESTERWLSGRRRPPGKRVHWVTGVEGSNPSLSAILKREPKYSTSAFYFAIIDLAVLDGEVAVPCNLQSALARWNSCERSTPVKLSLVDGDEILVLRNRTLRTVSGLDGSSTKENVLCAVRLPESNCSTKVTFGGEGSI